MPKSFTQTVKGLAYSLEDARTEFLILKSVSRCYYHSADLLSAVMFATEAELIFSDNISFFYEFELTFVQPYY